MLVLPAFPGVPISRPQIVELEPESVRLNWRRVDIPTFESHDEPLRYMIERNEPPSNIWSRVAGNIPDTTYIVHGLAPGQDYRFRVRSESPDGILGEPSPATSLYRTLGKSRHEVVQIMYSHSPTLLKQLAQCYRYKYSIISLVSYEWKKVIISFTKILMEKECHCHL